MLYNRKDVNIENGKAFFVGFVIAFGICAIFLLIFNVNAQIVVPDYKVGTFYPDTSQIAVNVDTGTSTVIKLQTLDRSLMTADQLQAVLHSEDLRISELNNLVSKYAKLYDYCR